MHIVFKAASCAAVLLASSTAFSQGAESYPSRTVTIVAPYAPGAAAEIEGRLWANELSKNLGQQFIMDFKPGAAQILGLSYTARQKPDGYTLAWITSTYSLLPLMNKEMGFDTYKDFDPVALMSKRSALLVVSNSLPVKNMQEYIAYAKANPGAVNFATGGLGGIQHLTGLWLTSATNTQVTFVHYKSISAAYPDIMAGRAHMAPGTLAGWLPMVKAGKLRAIATASLQRNPALPDLPTATEQGVTGFEYSSWLGMIAPTKTPLPIVNKIHAEFVKIGKNPQIMEKLGDETYILTLGPAEFRKVAMGETERFRKLVTDNNLKIE